MQLIGSLFYTLFLFAWTFFYSIFFVIACSFLPFRKRFILARVWGLVLLWALKWTCRLDYRVEGREKVSGQAQYAADFTMPGMLWAAYTTSPTPHAKIVSIDISAAQKMKGVHAVLTGKDLGVKYFGRRLFDWPNAVIGRARKDAHGRLPLKAIGRFDDGVAVVRVVVVQD